MNADAPVFRPGGTLEEIERAQLAASSQGPPGRGRGRGRGRGGQRNPQHQQKSSNDNDTGSVTEGAVLWSQV